MFQPQSELTRGEQQRPAYAALDVELCQQDMAGWYLKIWGNAKALWLIITRSHWFIIESHGTLKSHYIPCGIGM